MSKRIEARRGSKTDPGSISAWDIMLLASIYMRITSKLLPLPSKVAALEGNSFDRSSDFTFAINYGSSYSVTVTPFAGF